MSAIRIIGGKQLCGSLPISGAKNAALPLMIASLLTKERLILENLPFLADVKHLLTILQELGVNYAIKEQAADGQDPATPPLMAQRSLELQAGTIISTKPSFALVSKMRASFWVLGPLLARMGQACVPLPGGCAIGARPVDFILDGLKALGAKLTIANDHVSAEAPSGLIGNFYRFPKITVGGTHVLLMAAALANGQTELENCACEPEIVNLAQCLNAMGAQISGAGTANIVINGVSELKGAQIPIISDRIEAGTYAMAVAMAGGDLLLKKINSSFLPSVTDALRQAGCEIIDQAFDMRVRRMGSKIYPVDIITSAYPGFPTDLQAQFMALMTKACGISHIQERIFENRFMHVQELRHFGARIELEGDKAIIYGGSALSGAQVTATDLRASASLVIAALAAQGESHIGNVYHLDRGFEALEAKLSACGAIIDRIAS